MLKKRISQKVFKVGLRCVVSMMTDSIVSYYKTELNLERRKVFNIYVYLLIKL